MLRSIVNGEQAENTVLLICLNFKLKLFSRAMKDAALTKISRRMTATHEIYETHGVLQGGHLSPMCRAADQINFAKYHN